MDIQGDLRIGDWLVQPRLNRIAGLGVDHQVEPKVMEVLLCLAADPGAVVSRDELLERVWPDTVVVETTVFRAVSELRRLLDDDSKHPRVIETVRKRGYRLVAPVERAAPALPVNGGAASGNGGAERPGPAREPAPASELQPAGVSRTPARTWRVALPVAVTLAVVAVAAFQFRASSVTAPAPRAVWPSPPTGITSSPELEACPTLSPDGSGVAFAQARGEQWKIWVKLEGDATPRMLNPDRWCEFSPAWSPAGDDIVFWRELERGSELVVMPVLGGEARVLVHLPHSRGGGASWSADGRWIAASWRSARDEPRSIFLVENAETPEVRRVTTPPPGWFGDVQPALSPSGDAIAFVRSSVAGHVQDVYVAPLSGGEPRRLTRDHKPIRGIVWRDGEHLLVASKRSHRYALWQVSAVTGEISWTGISDSRNPSVAGRRDVVAFDRAEFEINVWQADVLTGETSPEPLIRTTKRDQGPHFRPDGKAIVFSSDRTGHHEIWTCDRDGASCRQLTDFQQFAARPRWSPDGRRIVMHADIEGNLDLFVIDRPGHPPRRLTRNVASDQAPSWSSDGRWIYFASVRTGAWEVFKVASGGGEPRRVTEDGGFLTRESPDGAWLYFTRPTQRGLWRMPAAGGAAELALEAFPYRTVGSWDFSGEKLVFPVPSRNGTRLMGFDVETGGTKELVRLPLARAVDWTISPDGGSVLFTQVDRRASDIFLVRLPAGNPP